MRPRNIVDRRGASDGTVGMSRLESEMDSESKLMESQLVSQDEESKLMDAGQNKEETLFHGFPNHMSFGDSDGGTCDKYSCDDDSFCVESFDDNNVFLLSVDLRDVAVTVPCDADDLNLVLWMFFVLLNVDYHVGVQILMLSLIHI